MDEIITPAAWAALDESARGAFPERLAERVRAFAQTGFAVLDGGHFDDLPGLLRREGLFARSLFLDHADVEIERAGPWLVALAQAAHAPETVFGLVGDTPAVVFWSSERGEPVLHRHLRRLNMARIPDWAAANERGPRSDGADDGNASVMFRHWDPRVLGALLPVLDAAQFVRILGPAEELVFWAADFNGLKRIVPDPRWPPAPSGPLTIRADQIALLTDRRVRASRQRVMAFLRDTVPEHAATRSEADLYRDVLRYEESARNLGMTSERSFGKWAHLMAASRGEIGRRDGPVHAYLTTAPGQADDKLEQLVAEMIVETRRAERGM